MNKKCMHTIIILLISITFSTVLANDNAFAATDQEIVTAAMQLLDWVYTENFAILNPIVETELQRFASALVLYELHLLSKEILLGVPQAPGSYQDISYSSTLGVLYGTDGTDGDFAAAINLSPSVTAVERAAHEAFLQWFVTEVSSTIASASLPPIETRAIYANEIHDWFFNQLAKMNMITQVGPDDDSVAAGFQPKYIGDRPKMCADGNGNVYVVYGSNRDANNDTPVSTNTIFFNYSRDYGRTWQMVDVPISTSADYARWIEIACDESGHVYVVWDDVAIGRTNGIYFNYSNDYGATWNTDRKLDYNSTARPNYPKIYCDNSGSVYAMWTLVLGEVYFSASYDYGLNWQVLRRLSNPAQSTATNGKLAYDSSGNIYATWCRESAADDDRIYFKYSNNKGITWNSDAFSDAIILDNTDTAPYADKTDPEIACDENGNVYVVWEDSRTSGVHLNYSNDRGATWNNDRKIDSQVLVSYGEPKLAVSSSGNIYITAQDMGWEIGEGHETEEGVYVNYSDDAGATFQPEWRRLDLPDDPIYEYYSGSQTIHAANNGGVYISWWDHRMIEELLPGSNIYYNYSIDSGQTWLNEPNVIKTSESFYNVDYVAVTSDNAGHMYITWNAMRLVWFFKLGVLEIALDINTQGHGLGTVALNPPDGVYDLGTVVTLTANADTNSFFTEWTGAISSTNNTETITMDSYKIAFANFALYGDVNEDGNVPASDALLTLKHSVAIYDDPILPLTGNSLKAADVDNSPGITAQDALSILKYSTGIISELPVPQG